MQLDLDDDETAALTRLLTNTSPRSDFEGSSRQDQTGAGSRAPVAAEGLCPAPRYRSQKATGIV